MEKFSMGQKVNDYFSKFYFIKLDELGEDHENYGNMIFNGNSHAPLKINVNYIMKRAKKKALEEIRNKKKSSKNEIIIIDDNYSEFDLKNKIFQYSELNLPLIKNKNININKSMGNLLSYNYEDQKSNSLINKNAQLNNSNNFSGKKQNNTLINIKNKNIKPKKKIFHMKREKIKEVRSTRSRNDGELNSLPKLKNKIFITNRNLRTFIQINKSEIQTEENKRNHILKRNAFLKRYDKKESITKRLTLLNNELLKINKNVSRIRSKSNEDIPQFILRFNNLMNKLLIK